MNQPLRRLNDESFFLENILAPVAYRRRQEEDESPFSMDSIPFGDLHMQCGAEFDEAAMSAGATAGITSAVFVVIIVAAIGVLFYLYKAKGYRFAKDAAQDPQAIEMGEGVNTTTTPKGNQWQTDM